MVVLGRWVFFYERDAPEVPFPDPALNLELWFWGVGMHRHFFGAMLPEAHLRDPCIPTDLRVAPSRHFRDPQFAPQVVGI